MRFIWDKHAKTFVPRDEYIWRRPKGPLVMKDIDPFISPIDRREITSRSQLRAHERSYGVRQIGNDMNDYYQNTLGVELKR